MAGFNPSELLKFNKEAYFKKYGRDIMEKTMNQFVETTYPKLAKTECRRRSIYESQTASIEETYYWYLDYLTEGKNGYPIIEKITDVFTAAEHSSFWGQQAARLSAQQDKVSQYLATIGKMIKDMFQLVRELRILDERLGYYIDSMDPKSTSRDSAEITLKGIYVDMAEGGSKNPSSVFGLARELQFTTLPDLFFKIHPATPKDVDPYVDKLEFNRKVKEVLKRKLRSYLEWRDHTLKELKTRKQFTLKYTRQHYDVINMYLMWIRPYLRSIARLQSETMEEEKTTSPHVISAFEGSLIEVEFLAKKMPDSNKEVYAVVIGTFSYRTRASMSYQQEGYRHQGPVHVGRVETILRAYGMTEHDIQQYKLLRASEDYEMIGKIDRSVRDAMEGLGAELQKYLEEAGEELLLKKEGAAKKDAGKKQAPGILSTFINVKPTNKKKSEEQPKSAWDPSLKSEQKTASADAQQDIWVAYKNYKKSKGFLAW